MLSRRRWQLRRRLRRRRRHEVHRLSDSNDAAGGQDVDDGLGVSVERLRRSVVPGGKSLVVVGVNVYDDTAPPRCLPAMPADFRARHHDHVP